ncbi:MAG: Cystathionine gamma-lyase, partial [uncultured Nocardioides sp.]
RGRQHLRLAVPPAAADAGRRRGGALDDEVRRWALRRRRGRPRRARPRAGRQDRLPPELHGRRLRPLRRVLDPPRTQDAGCAHGPPLRQRGEGRRLPRLAPQGGRGHLPGSCGPPRPRGGCETDEAVRRHRQLPGHRRRAARARRVREGRGLHARRVAGWHRVAHRAPRPDDARERRRHRPRGPCRPHPVECGHRDRRGPAGRPRPRPRL